MGMIQLKRVYDPPARDDGMRILVDRLWPRGLKRAEAKIDVWLKDIAPSAELRRWFGHETAKWPEFRQRYRAELVTNPALPAFRDMVRCHAPITLVFGAKDTDRNNAVVLRDLMRESDRP